MSYDDNHRPDGSRDRGAYTPPAEDDLPFNRGGFDARRAPPGKAPPVTLIVSTLVLLFLIVAVVVFYNIGGKPSSDAPPLVGAPVGDLRVQAPVDAQPVDPEAGIEVYRDAAEPTDAAPTFTPPPEAVQPRPAPKPLPPVVSDELPPAPTQPRPAQPRPTTPASAVPAATPRPAPGAATGASAVQIGAFSTTAIADREFAAVASRFPQFARGADKRVQEVTASNGSTVYRTTFTGLSRERAVAFCEAIKAAGDDCLVR